MSHFCFSLAPEKVDSVDSKSNSKAKVREKECRKKLRKSPLKLITPLSIPQSNPAAKCPASSERKHNESSVEDTSVLLERLKLLQEGKVTSVQNQRSNPLSNPKNQEVKEEEIKRNKDEVQKLNIQIQQKISGQIKPKLRQILGRPETYLVKFSNSLEKTNKHELAHETYDQQMEHRKVRIVKKQTRPVPIAKTTVNITPEKTAQIYRYTRDDLNQLQSTANCELVPRLKDLKICSTTFNDLDLFLLKLLNTKDEKWHSLILETAESRKLVQRKGPTDFIYSPLSVESEQRPDHKVNDSEKFENLKALAKNEDELNELVYRFEFDNLFADVLKDQSIRDQPLSIVVQHLIDTKQANIILGEVRVNSRNNQEAYVSHTGAKDVCINKIVLRKYSFQGDYVKILVKNILESQEDGDNSSIAMDGDFDATIPSETLLDNRNYGCVLEIIEQRHSRRVIGSMPKLSKKKKRGKLIVRDTRVPNVRIRTDEVPNGMEITDKTLMVVQITGWSQKEGYAEPKGKIVQVIGDKGLLKVENEAILLQHNLNPTPFTRSIIDQLPTTPFIIPPEEYENRLDLRNTCIFSIDPETARDLDDALSCEILPNGNLLVGVHISDVSYFIKENSELDTIVKERATSIYLVDTVYHMLPEPLCMLCSLLPGADKMAYTVFWEMKGDTAEIVSTKFSRSVLNSCAKLSYEQAQVVIDKGDHEWSILVNQFPEIHNGFKIDDVANVIVQLQKLAVIMRNNRKLNGSLKIDQPKLSFKFNKDDQRMETPVDFFQYLQRDSNRLIEEFMLLANISVAKFIYEKFPTISLLRHHEVLLIYFRFTSIFIF